MSAGYVYAMTNPDYPGAFKVGMTERTPEDRAKELSAGTGVRSPFSVYRAAYTPYAAGHEKVAHAALAGFRDSPNKEFFYPPAEVLNRLFDTLEGAVLYQDWWVPLVEGSNKLEGNSVPPISEDELRTPVAKTRFRAAEELELTEDGTCPHTLVRHGNIHANVRLPKELGGGHLRKSLKTSDHATALEQMRIILKCIARDLDTILTSGD
ncbi:hypothetical protein [Phaeobacter phage MD18]|nr:hypothetical protein [Phaeobacter phage MD18]